MPFETLAELKGVEHLDRVGTDKVAVLTKAETGRVAADDPAAVADIPLP